MKRRIQCSLWLAFLICGNLALADVARNGMAADANGHNLALLVGAPNGLPGVDLDLGNMGDIASNGAYKFQSTKLFDSQASRSALLDNLKSLSGQVGKTGSLLFYFSGHGNRGIIAADNFQIVSIDEIRDAISSARESIGPLDRLTMIFDSCNAGSLLDPLRGAATPWNRMAQLDGKETSAEFVDAVMRAFSIRDGYWQNLVVFASSTAAEESQGDDKGGIFTQAMRKAFDEVNGKHGTVGEFISKTKSYTGDEQHPVARLVPQSLENETLGL